MLIAAYRKLIIDLRKWGAIAFPREFHQSFSTVRVPSTFAPDKEKPDKVLIIKRSGRMECIIIKNNSFARGTNFSI